jgi:hypothetical protein
MKRCPLDFNPGEPAKCDPLHKSPTIINATLKHRSSNSIATIPARALLPDDVDVRLLLDRAARLERDRRRRCLHNPT